MVKENSTKKRKKYIYMCVCVCVCVYREREREKERERERRKLLESLIASSNLDLISETYCHEYKSHTIYMPPQNPL